MILVPCTGPSMQRLTMLGVVQSPLSWSGNTPYSCLTVDVPGAMLQLLVGGLPLTQPFACWAVHGMTLFQVCWAHHHQHV